MSDCNFAYMQSKILSYMKFLISRHKYGKSKYWCICNLFWRITESTNWIYGSNIHNTTYICWYMWTHFWLSCERKYNSLFFLLIFLTLHAIYHYSFLQSIWQNIFKVHTRKKKVLNFWRMLFLWRILLSILFEPSKTYLHCNIYSQNDFCISNFRIKIFKVALFEKYILVESHFHELLTKLDKSQW